MNLKRKFLLLCLVIAAVSSIAGCAGRSQELLAEDFVKMGNDDLLRYFYRLNDEIESQESASGPQFGIGMGSFGHGVGGGVGVGTGSQRSIAEDLRTRRIDVRMELKKRGMNP
jgi:hypothetical protein